LTPVAGLEVLQSLPASFGIFGSVDRAQRRHDGLAVFQDTNSSEWRIRCTMQVWTTVWERRR
jgi:hypothetical protein